MNAATQIIKGIPTNSDVRILVEAFRGRAEGEDINFSEIESHIGYSRRTPRFRTVVNAWRKELERTSNTVLESIHGIGFRIVPAGERTKHGARWIGKGFRAVRRGAEKIRRVPVEKLTERERSTHDHVQRLSDGVEMALRSTVAGVKAVLAPMKQNPRVLPPASKTLSDAS